MDVSALLVVNVTQFYSTGITVWLGSYHSSERDKVNISKLGWPCVMGALIFDECTCVYCTRMFYFMTRANATDTPVAKGLM